MEAVNHDEGVLVGVSLLESVELSLSGLALSVVVLQDDVEDRLEFGQMLLNLFHGFLRLK